ncbi:hypothetical protein A3Q56_00195 [Intoshia linei]|uniref:FERM domain-containing protein n=1 Tax=Intoshia linei TaxID=1819745 RepID=A0A177BCU0_9BILA|nr:hypothetical protein A3Q56_00195 [Intoshia linei]
MDSVKNNENSVSDSNDACIFIYIYSKGSFTMTCSYDMNTCKNVTAESIIMEICRKLAITAFQFNAFALRTLKSNIWLSPNRLMDPFDEQRQHLIFRVRFKPLPQNLDEWKYFDQSGFNYLYEQMVFDFKIGMMMNDTPSNKFVCIYLAMLQYFVECADNHQVPSNDIYDVVCSYIPNDKSCNYEKSYNSIQKIGKYFFNPKSDSIKTKYPINVLKLQFMRYIFKNIEDYMNEKFITPDQKLVSVVSTDRATNIIIECSSPDVIINI